MLFIHLLLLPLFASAREEAQRGGPSGSGRIDGNQCPYDTLYEIDAHMVYSPFKPFWKFTRANANTPNCWLVSDCLFEAAGESRKQQFAATALVMGLIPLTIKDIAWPARRIIFVTLDLPWWAEILVLSLGLVPMKTGNQKVTRRRSCQSGPVAARGWKMKKNSIRYCILICLAMLLLCLASLFVMEAYSKRSSLGCPVPIFVAMWHIIALIPGAIHSFFAKFRSRRYERKNPHLTDPSLPLSAHHERLVGETLSIASFQRSRLPAHGLHIDINDENEEDEHAEPTGRERERKIASAIQGANEAWPVQMAWGVYYIAGTLVFTSIMAVTVPELVVWVMLGLAMAASSKLLAFFLSLSFEETGLRKPNEAFPVAQR
jgi:hypothetical protein